MGISKLPFDRWEQQTSKLTCSIFHSHWWTQHSSPDPSGSKPMLLSCSHKCSLENFSSFFLRVVSTHAEQVGNCLTACWVSPVLWTPSRGFLLFPDSGLTVGRLLSSLPCLLNRNPAAAWMPEDLILETEAGMWVERIWGVVGSINIFFSWGHPEL